MMPTLTEKNQILFNLRRKISELSRRGFRIYTLEASYERLEISPYFWEEYLSLDEKLNGLLLDSDNYNQLMGEMYPEHQYENESDDWYSRQLKKSYGYDRDMNGEPIDPYRVAAGEGDCYFQTPYVKHAPHIEQISPEKELQRANKLLVEEKTKLIEENKKLKEEVDKCKARLKELGEIEPVLVNGKLPLLEVD